MKSPSHGNFTPEGSTFLLTNPLLDRPWMNVRSNGAWCDVCSHLGGGYSFLGNPTGGRITRWHIDGTSLTGNLVPAQPAGGTHRVDVVISHGSWPCGK